jgi:hypothetical protein
MNYRKALQEIFFLVVLCLVGAATVRAQDDTQPPQQPQEPVDESGPKPAGHSNPYFDIGNLIGNPGDLQPDYTPLTGMLNAGLGFPEVKHSYWVPGIQFSSNVQSNSYGGGNNSNWFADNYVVGNLSLLEAWSHAQVAVNYSGGGYFSTDSSQGNGWYQQLNFAQTLQLNRWLVQIADDFSYLPTSAFGFGAGSNLGGPGVGGSLGPTIPGLGGSYVPNQTIFAGTGPRYSNSIVVQATYQLSRRSSLTTSGSYGILHFIDPGNIDTDSAFGGLGYNYLLSHKDTIGLFYQYSTYHFPGSPQAYGSQIASVAYSRKITGRLALSVFGGPQFTSLRVPVGTTSSTVSGYASAYLTYGFENGSLSGNYVHGLSGGSGLLLGSILDQVYFTGSRKLSRVWSGTVNVGYAHNRSIVSPEATVANQDYNSWYAGGGVSRPFGRNFNFSLNYSANFANYNIGCTGAGCGTSSTSTYQYVTMNLQWHPRPFVLP